jgi:hypothetical protein
MAIAVMTHGLAPGSRQEEIRIAPGGSTGLHGAQLHPPGLGIAAVELQLLLHAPRQLVKGLKPLPVRGFGGGDAVGPRKGF